MDPVHTPTEPLDLCLLVTRAEAALRRRFDRPLSGWHGLSLNDFTLLDHLDRAPEQQMRRVDLAERVGLSPSGVTRLLAPLERIGLVERRADPSDARVSLAALTPTGRRHVGDARRTAGQVATDLVEQRLDRDEVAALTALLTRLTG
jgi:DNA-binding MarR family transcriptional regulator